MKYIYIFLYTGTGMCFNISIFLFTGKEIRILYFIFYI